MERILYPGNYQGIPGKSYAYHDTNILFALFGRELIDGSERPDGINLTQEITNGLHPMTHLALLQHYLAKGGYWLGKNINLLRITDADCHFAMVRLLDSIMVY